MTFRTQQKKLAISSGFTLFEVLVAMAILGLLATIGTVAYTGYIENTKISNARNQITAMSIVIKDFYAEKNQYPNSLADVGLNTLLDPWGNPYHYLNIATANIGDVRKDHNLVPLNTDYDLYSSGEDGQSAPPLTAKASRDDIVRANNGGFVGMASDY